MITNGGSLIAIGLASVLSLGTANAENLLRPDSAITLAPADAAASGGCAVDDEKAKAVEFWPLHRDYETELSKLNDQKLVLIQRYAETYKSMTEKEAAKLAKGSFDLEAKKTGLKRKYFTKFQKAIPATKAARFFQIENQLSMVLDLQVAASFP